MNPLLEGAPKGLGLAPKPLDPNALLDCCGCPKLPKGWDAAPKGELPKPKPAELAGAGLLAPPKPNPAVEHSSCLMGAQHRASTYTHNNNSLGIIQL